MARQVIIEVSGGIVTDVTGLPDDVEVVVHDYDRENYTEERLAESPDGQYAILPLVTTAAGDGTEKLEGSLADPLPKPKLDPTDPERHSDPIPFVVEVTSNSIAIGFRGYGEAEAAVGYGRPIFIEHYDGKLALRVWSDINDADPTHTIDLHGALESLSLRTET